MANLILPDTGLTRWLLYGVSASGLNYHLFTNVYTCQNITTLSNFTECIISGYAPINVTASDFTIKGVAGHVGTVQGAAITFIATSGSTYAQGWFATDSTNATLMACQTFDTPQLFQLGSPVVVIPAFGDMSQLSF